MANDRAQYGKQVSSFFDSLSPSCFEVSHCILCPAGTPYIELFSKSGLKVCRCKCGFVYSGLQPKKEVLDTFYKESSAMLSWSKIKSSGSESSRQSEKFRHAVDYIANSVFIKSVMDIGCGTGVFLSMLKRARPALELYGVDSHPGSVDYAREQGLSVELCSIETTLEYPKNYDCISLWGVLEHVKDPIGTLQAVADRLNPHGVVVLCVPNVESSVVRALWDKCFTFCPQHLWYFSEVTLSAALNRAGFELIDTSTIEPEGLPLLKYMNGLAPYGDHLPIWDPVYSNLPVFERQLLNAKKGYKIVALAKKSPDKGLNAA